MDKEFFSNNYQEGIFEPSEEKREKVMETKETTNDGTEEKKERYYTSSIAVPRQTPVAYTSVYRSSASESIIQVIYGIGGILNLFLAIRLLLKLVGANTTNLVAAIYNLTEPFVAPFRGIFPNSDVPRAGFFETQSLLAIIAVTLVTLGMAALVKASFRRQ